MRCPAESVIAAYVEGGLDPRQRQDVERHIATCASCHTSVTTRLRAAEFGVDDTVKDPESAGPLPLPPTTPRGVAPRGRNPDAFASHGPGADTVRRPTPPRELQLVAGTMVGEYEVTGRIGAGGMGAVFSAVHPRIGKQAAIKVLLRQATADPNALVRFENEAKAVNAIGHPNIVDIFAFGELPDGNPYFVMERVDGESLEKWLEQRGRLALEHAMPILTQIFDALTAAHERGIIHRDLKPGNIMVAGAETAPRVKILDFGLAKMARKKSFDDVELTAPGVAMGTPLFMSPEQFLGESVDHRTDVYALGVIVYRMLTGRYPFAGDTPTVIGIQHVADHAPPPSAIVPSLPPGIDAAVMRALAKDPHDRYATVGELRDALVACIPPDAMIVPVSGRRLASEPSAHSGQVPIAAAAAMTAAPATASAHVHAPRQPLSFVVVIAAAITIATVVLVTSLNGC